MHNLINKANSGQANSPTTINNSIFEQEPRDEIQVIPRIKQVVHIQDKRREIAKKWYADPKIRRT